MANDELTPDVEQDDNEEIVEASEGETEEAKEKDWKAEAKNWRKEAFTARKELKASQTKKTTKQPDDLGYGEKAFLKASGLVTKDEISFAHDFMKDTGKDIESTLDSKYFQAELKEMRELKATEAATPSGTKRAGQSATDQVDYWLAKGELPPASERDLRQKVVNARMKKEGSSGVFYNS